MSPDGILETALYVEDLDRAEAFYVGVLGLERISAVPGRHVFFRCGNGVLLVFRPAATEIPPPPDASLPVPPHGARGPGHACFRAEASDFSGWISHLEKHGIAIEADFEWPQGGRSIYFRDPDGNSLEFAEPRIWGLS